jgi:hypothetical protein
MRGAATQVTGQPTIGCSPAQLRVAKNRSGRVVWNRSRFIKVPGSNKRVARPRPRSEWRTSDRPELRIVSDELWQAVQLRQTRMQQLYSGNHGLLNRSASSGHLLTGFIKCGLCGANLVIVTGRKRRHAMYGCPQHWYRGACTNGLRMRQAELESQLLSELQKAVLQPSAIGHVLDQFKHQLDSAQVDFSQEKERTQGRRKELDEELTRLTAAVAESGHSATLLHAIADRERQLTEIETSLRQEHHGFGKSLEELQQFALKRLSSLPDLLSCDVPRARAELAKHVTQVTMHPAEQNGDRHYTCQGDWNLLGNLICAGDVRMVAGGGFEPPTFGL